MHASTSSSAVSRAVTTAPAARRAPLASHASGGARSQRASTSSGALSGHPSRPPTAGRRGASRASPKRRGTRPRRGPRGRILRLFVRSTRRAGARVPRRRLLRRRILRRRLLRRRPARPVGGRLRAAGAARRAPPDVTLLTQREIQSLLPIGATGEQYAYFWGGPETAVQRLGLSLVGLVATVNLTALLAVPTATFSCGRRGAAARRNSRRARDGTSGCGAPGSSRWRRATPPRARGTSTSASDGRRTGEGIEAIFLWEFWQPATIRSRRPAKPGKGGDLDAVVARGRLQRRQGGAQGPAAEAAREDTRGGRGGDGGRIGRELFRAF